MRVPSRCARVLVPVIVLVVRLTMVVCGSSTKAVSPLRLRSCTVQGLSARCGTLSPGCRKTA